MSAVASSQIVPNGYNRAMVCLRVPSAPKAVQWYKDVLGFEERKRVETPDKKYVMLSELQLDNLVVFLNDIPLPPGMKPGPSNATLYIYVADVDGKHALALKNGASELSPPKYAFYGDRMSCVLDPFGNQWALASIIQANPDNDTNQRIEEIGKWLAASEAANKNCCAAPTSKEADEKHNQQQSLTAGACTDAANGAAEPSRWKKMSHIHHGKVSDRKPRPIVSESEWLSQHQQHLSLEKDLTHHKDYVISRRLQLPWTEIRSDYIFEDLHGKKLNLSELFVNPNLDDLIIYHQMLPLSLEDNDSCPGCASFVDSLNGNLPFLLPKMNIAVVAKGQPKLLADCKKARGWSDKLPYYSTHLSTFNEDLAFSCSPAENEEFKKLVAETGNNDYHSALSKLRKQNPSHPCVRFNLGTGMIIPLLNLPGLTVFHYDRKNNKIYKTFTVGGRGSEYCHGSVGLTDLLPFGRETPENQ